MAKLRFVTTRVMIFPSEQTGAAFVHIITDMTKSGTLEKVRKHVSSHYIRLHRPRFITLFMRLYLNNLLVFRNYLFRAADENALKMFILGNVTKNAKRNNFLSCIGSG